MENYLEDWIGSEAAASYLELQKTLLEIGLVKYL